MKCHLASIDSTISKILLEGDYLRVKPYLTALCSEIEELRARCSLLEQANKNANGIIGATADECKAINEALRANHEGDLEKIKQQQSEMKKLIDEGWQAIFSARAKLEKAKTFLNQIDTSDMSPDEVAAVQIIIAELGKE